ncbi:Protein of unknown function, partial [Gryllus bimaculatus]
CDAEIGKYASDDHLLLNGLQTIPACSEKTSSQQEGHGRTGKGKLALIQSIDILSENASASVAARAGRERGKAAGAGAGAPGRVGSCRVASGRVGSGRRRSFPQGPRGRPGGRLAGHRLRLRPPPARRRRGVFVWRSLGGATAGAPPPTPPPPPPPPPPASLAPAVVGSSHVAQCPASPRLAPPRVASVAECCRPRGEGADPCHRRHRPHVARAACPGARSPTPTPHRPRRSRAATWTPAENTEFDLLECRVMGM